MADKLYIISKLYKDKRFTSLLEGDWYFGIYPSNIYYNHLNALAEAKEVFNIFWDDSFDDYEDDDKIVDSLIVKFSYLRLIGILIYKLSELYRPFTSDNMPPVLSIGTCTNRVITGVLTMWIPVKVNYALIIYVKANLTNNLEFNQDSDITYQVISSDKSSNPLFKSGEKHSTLSDIYNDIVKLINGLD